MNKLNGLIVDYFGVFNDLQKALNFDESVREEAAINWDRLKEQVPLELGRCMAPFHGIKIDDTRDCLLACLRRLSDSQVALEFETNFKHLEALWEALSPDECLYPYRHEYAWLCAMYIAHRRRNRRNAITHDELAQKTRELIQQFTELLATAEDVPVYKVDADYLVKVQALPTAADRAAELEAALTAELIDGPDGFAYKQLGERLKQAVEAKQNDDEAALRFLREAEEIVYDVNAIKTEPQRLGLTQTGEFELYTVIKAFVATPDEALCVQAAKAMIKHLRDKHYLPAGWSATLGGRKRVSLELQILSWDAPFDALQLAPTDLEDAAFLKTAVEELAKVMP
jgi:type I restriction enzyme R subunit